MANLSRTSNGMATAIQRLDSLARQNGTSAAALAQQHCAPCDSALIRTVGFDPSVKCSEDMSRFLCWMDKGKCSYNQFGVPSAIKLRTNTIALPDPTNGFQIGPGAGATSLGVFFPRTWVGEMVYHGISRIKVSFAVANLVSASGITNADVRSGLFDDLDVRILQTGSVDPFHVVLQLEAQDAQRSELAPAIGGFFFPANGSFVPYALAPELFTFDFQGNAPGGAGDSYSLGATVRSYWDKVC